MSNSIINIETNIKEIYKNNYNYPVTLNINWTSFNSNSSGYFSLIIYKINIIEVEGEEPTEEPEIVDIIYSTCNNSTENLNYRYVLPPNFIFGVEKDLNSSCSVIYYTIENI